MRFCISSASRLGMSVNTSSMLNITSRRLFNKSIKDAGKKSPILADVQSGAKDRDLLGSVGRSTEDWVVSAGTCPTTVVAAKLVTICFA